MIIILSTSQCTHFIRSYEHLILNANKMMSVSVYDLYCMDMIQRVNFILFFFFFHLKSLYRETYGMYAIDHNCGALIYMR